MMVNPLNKFPYFRMGVSSRLVPFRYLCYLNLDMVPAFNLLQLLTIRLKKGLALR